MSYRFPPYIFQAHPHSPASAQRRSPVSIRPMQPRIFLTYIPAQLNRLLDVGNHECKLEFLDGGKNEKCELDMEHFRQARLW